MLLDYLDTVRQKPLAARKRFAFFVAVGFTAVVGVLWGFTLPARFASLSVAGDGLTQNEALQDLGDQMSEGKDGFKEIMDARELTNLLPQEEQQGLEAAQQAAALLGVEGADIGSTSPSHEVSQEQPPLERPVIIETVPRSTTAAASSTTE